MISEPCFLDTNIALYTLGNDNDFRGDCLQLLRAAASGELEAVTDVEVLQEIAYQTTGRGRRDAGLHLARQFTTIVGTVYPVDAVDVEAMFRFMERHPLLPPRDALHLAVMQRHGVTHIITTDKHFSALPGLVTLDPQAAARRLRD